MLGFGGIGALAKGAASLAGQGLKGVATGKSGATAAGAFYGAMGGGIWGGVSNDTSVLGGMAMGGLMGAGIGRYGGAGIRMANRGGKGMKFGMQAKTSAQKFGLGAFGQMRRDYRGVKGYLGGKGEAIKAQARAGASKETIGSTKIASNAAVNKIPALKYPKNPPPGVSKMRYMRGTENAFPSHGDFGKAYRLPKEAYMPRPRGENQTLRAASKMWSQTKPKPQLSTLELAKMQRLGY